MPGLNEEHASEVVAQLYEELGSPTEVAIAAFDELGKEFLDIKAEGRSNEELEILGLSIKSMSRIKFLLGAISAIGADPENEPSEFYIMPVLPKYLEIFPKIITNSLCLIDYLLGNQEILCRELEIEELKELGVIRSGFESIQKRAEIDKASGRMLFDAATLMRAQYVNLYSFELLTGPLVVREYVDWTNLVGRVLMTQQRAYNKKHNIKTHWVN
jgi:hypothetical protein